MSLEPRRCCPKHAPTSCSRLDKPSVVLSNLAYRVVKGDWKHFYHICRDYPGRARLKCSFGAGNGLEE